MRFAILCALILGGETAWAALQPMGLEDAIRYAVEHSPRLNTFARERTIGRYTRQNVLAAFLPSLDLTTTHGIRRDSPLTTANPWASDFALDLTETLYDNGQNITQYRIARLREEQTNETFLLERDRLSRDVAQQYLRLSQTIRALEVQQSQFDIIRRQFDLVASGYRQGLKTQKDYLRFKAQLGRNELDIENARIAVDRETERLKSLIALPVDDPTSFRFSPVAAAAQVPAIPTEIPELKENRVFHITERTNAIAKLEASLVRRKVWPEITLSSGVNYRTANYVNYGNFAERFTENDRLSWNALVGLKFNLFDWGIRSRDAAIALERQLIQENDSALKLIDLREELTNLMRELRVKQKDYQLSGDLLELEKRNLRGLTEDYRLGRVGYLDYITAVESLGTAQLKFYSSFYDLQQARYNYLFQKGTLYDEIQKP